MRVKPDREADFRSFFADSYADALRFAQRRTTLERAEDVVAEAMLVVWRRFDDAPDDSGERRAWLFGIVRNTILNASRSEARQAAVAVKIIDADGVRDSPDHADHIAQRLDLARAWAQLADGHQEVLALAVFEQLTAAQAARVLGISGVAFRTRLTRARRALQSLVPHFSPSGSSPTFQEARP
jgi:RNA polymerase sigma-70 factor (ECF subfamily)